MRKPELLLLLLNNAKTHIMLLSGLAHVSLAFVLFSRKSIFLYGCSNLLWCQVVFYYFEMRTRIACVRERKSNIRMGKYVIAVVLTMV